MHETPETIREAAFRLFATNGYDATSVEQIVAAAGVSRSTFFRIFESKETVIFPDHDRFIETVSKRLRASTHDSALDAVSDAVRLVLFHYVAEGERARERYRLTSRVPALRERELIESARYQRLFQNYIGSWAENTDQGQLEFDLTAAAVVTARNRVLRRWLRDEGKDPQREIDAALTTVRKVFAGQVGGEPILIVVPESIPMRQVSSHIAGWIQAKINTSVDT